MLLSLSQPNDELRAALKLQVLEEDYIPELPAGSHMAEDGIRMSVRMTTVRLHPPSDDSHIDPSHY